MDLENQPALTLRRAVQAVGSQTKFAELLEVSQQAVSLWIRRNKVLPAEHVRTVSAATGISVHDLRPDLYPRDPGDDHAAPIDLEPAR